MREKQRTMNRQNRWYKAVSMLLVLALTVSLLSGCGKKAENNAATDTTGVSETGADTDTETGTVQEEPATESSQELFNDSLDRLLTEVSEGDMEEAEVLYEEIQNNLDLMDEEAECITDNSGVIDSLSSDAQALLTERTEGFKEELTESRTEIEELADALESSLASGDAETSLALIEEIKGMTEGETEVHTYGETLQNETASNQNKAALSEAVYETGKYGEDVYEAAYETGAGEASLSVSDEALTSCAGITELSDEMKELADELSTPLEIYNYVKNNIGYEYYYGSRKGAAGTYDSMNGNDVDQASLLIAMLRYKGYPAMYVQGNILIEPEMAMSLTGADTAEHAADVLASNGVSVTKLTSNGQVVFIKMEHVWVRTLVPYGNYRGAGEAEGEAVWIDLDTGIKEYEAVSSIHDVVDKEALSPQFDEAIASDDMETFNTLYSEACAECEEILSEMDLENTYVRKRIIKQQDEIYLPLSLQYEVDSENETFAEVPASLRDTVSFEVDGFTIAEYNVDELSGKSILLSYEAATDEDEEILAVYGDLFSTPSYAAYMTPVLYVDGGAVSGKDEEFLYSTLGSDSSFRIIFSTKDGKTYIDNTITTGSMYAVTLDAGSIDDTQLESLYNEIISLQDSVAKDNVYSPEYMGRYLAFTGKLYYAQLDLTYTVAADSYDIAVTRNLSEAITGYEVEKEYLYGMVRGIGFGQMFMDVDMDSHSASSLYGDEAAKKEYLFTTGIMGSTYESGIFEELTGEPAVSTVSILREASDRGIDILAINSSNLEEGLALLDTTNAVVSDIRSAVNRGDVVFIPCEDITMGGWSGTGYIILDVETGTGSYMISGGLNGGCTEGEVLYDTMVEFGLTLIDITEGLITIFQVINVMKAAKTITLLGAGQIVLAGLCIGLSVWSCAQTFRLYEAYVAGSEEAGEEIVTQTICDAVLTIGLTLFTAVAKPVLKLIMKNKLIKSLGADVLEELLANGATIEELSSLFKRLKNLGLSDDIISAFAKNFGDAGLDFLRQAKGLNVSTDLLLELSKRSDLADRLDDILALIKNSSRSADEVAECIIKYGDDAFSLISKYGDDAVDAIIKHGDEAIEVIGKYGDDAVDGFKKGKTPDEIKAEYGGGGSTASGLTDEKIQEILNTPKGSRPDPSTYLSQEYIDAHLSKFEDGAAYFMSYQTYDEIYRTSNKVGWDDGTLFVVPKNEVDTVLKDAGGDLTKLEEGLGYDIGSLKEGDYVVLYINNPEKYNISLPSGNEMGANDNWIPGGYTSGGVPEAIVYDVDNIPGEVYYSDPINFKRK